MSKTQIIITDDNKEFNDVLCEYFNTQDDIEVVGSASDGLEAIDLIISKKPNVVLLDIIMPNLDGLGVLEKINTLNNNEKPIAIVLSAIGHDDIAQQAMNLGASYYIVKPFNLDILASRIRQMVSLKNKTKLPVEKKDIEITVTDIIHELGIPAHLMGYKYLRDAIIMVVNEPDLINHVTKKLYPAVAERHDTLSNRVDRSIRHAVDNSWNVEALGALRRIFAYTNIEKPSNSELIAMVADKLRLDLKE